MANNEPCALISIYSDSYETSELINDALLSDNLVNKNGLTFFSYEEETYRNLDTNWIMLVLALIPAAESAYNIAKIIKDEISKKITNELYEQNINKSIKTKIIIKLPFYSYESEETIVVIPKGVKNV